MVLVLNEADLGELNQQSPAPELEAGEELAMVSKQLGQGYNRGIELAPGLWLNWLDCEYHQDLQVQVAAHDHPIQLGIHLSGFIYFDAVHPDLGGARGYFSGSGISPGYVEKYRSGERVTIVSVDVEPEWLEAFLQDGQYEAELRHLLFKGEDWKLSFYPRVTPAMRTLARQLWSPPYRGAARRMYLQGKVLELLAMHLDWLAACQLEGGQLEGGQSRLKSDTIARIHQAKEMLTARLDNPPLLLDLAQQVGLSDRTLRRGFQRLFGMTVCGYLMDQRLIQAEQLLRHSQLTVAEVMHRSGYSNQGHFAAAFKRKFGMTPKQCAMGQKSVGDG
jgi:AraC-like DNA-binding protein